jgi:hypothetical protein
LESNTSLQLAEWFDTARELTERWHHQQHDGDRDLGEKILNLTAIVGSEFLP